MAATWLQTGRASGASGNQSSSAPDSSASTYAVAPNPALPTGFSFNQFLIAASVGQEVEASGAALQRIVGVK